MTEPTSPLFDKFKMSALFHFFKKVNVFEARNRIFPEYGNLRTEFERGLNDMNRLSDYYDSFKAMRKKNLNEPLLDNRVCKIILDNIVPYQGGTEDSANCIRALTQLVFSRQLLTPEEHHFLYMRHLDSLKKQSLHGKNHEENIHVMQEEQHYLLSHKCFIEPQVFIEYAHRILAENDTTLTQKLSNLYMHMENAKNMCEQIMALQKVHQIERELEEKLPRKENSKDNLLRKRSKI